VSGCFCFERLPVLCIDEFFLTVLLLLEDVVPGGLTTRVLLADVF